MGRSPRAGRAGNSGGRKGLGKHMGTEQCMFLWGAGTVTRKPEQLVPVSLLVVSFPDCKGDSGPAMPWASAGTTRQVPVLSASLKKHSCLAGADGLLGKCR